MKRNEKTKKKRLDHSITTSNTSFLTKTKNAAAITRECKEVRAGVWGRCDIRVRSCFYTCSASKDRNCAHCNLNPQSNQVHLHEPLGRVCFLLDHILTYLSVQDCWKAMQRGSKMIKLDINRKGSSKKTFVLDEDMTGIRYQPSKKNSRCK